MEWVIVTLLVLNLLFVFSHIRFVSRQVSRVQGTLDVVVETVSTVYYERIAMEAKLIYLLEQLRDQREKDADPGDEEEAEMTKEPITEDEREKIKKMLRKQFGIAEHGIPPKGGSGTAPPLRTMRGILRSDGVLEEDRDHG